MNSRALIAGGIGLVGIALLGSDTGCTMSDRRQGALALCAFYLPCTHGDPHYEEICKDFGQIGTTCGYLPGFVLFRMGCREKRLVNRSEPKSGLVYKPGMNIAALVQGGKATGALRFYKPGSGIGPKEGDILYFGQVAPVTGGISKEHVNVLRTTPDLDSPGVLETYDLGRQAPDGGQMGEMVRREWDPRTGLVQFLGGNRSLVAWLDLDSVPFTASSDVCDRSRGVV